MFLSRFKENKVFMMILDFVLNIIFVVFLALIIRNYLISPFHVYGPSMCNTLNYTNDYCVDEHGDYIIVNELVYANLFGFRISAPKMFDVIVFKPPNNEKLYYVKRVLGVPGDKLRIVDGYLYKYVNDEYQLVDESSYLNFDSLGHTYALKNSSDPVDFEVPAESYFVMGDNRNRSTDSRHCFVSGVNEKCDNSSSMSFVPFENIRGKAWFVFYPFVNMGKI